MMVFSLWAMVSTVHSEKASRIVSYRKIIVFLNIFGSFLREFLPVWGRPSLGRWPLWPRPVWAPWSSSAARGRGTPAASGPRRGSRRPRSPWFQRRKSNFSTFFMGNCISLASKNMSPGRFLTYALRWACSSAVQTSRSLYWSKGSWFEIFLKSIVFLCRNKWCAILFTRFMRRLPENKTGSYSGKQKRSVKNIFFTILQM